LRFSSWRPSIYVRRKVSWDHTPVDALGDYEVSLPLRDEAFPKQYRHIQA
jgi:hypothetical protein